MNISFIAMRRSTGYAWLDAQSQAVACSDMIFEAGDGMQVSSCHVLISRWTATGMHATAKRRPARKLVSIP
jgi:hypothetical protein